MGRYVDLGKLPQLVQWQCAGEEDTFVAVADVLQALRQTAAETGEVAEVKHAHWVTISRYWVKCSACGGVLGKPYMDADPYCGHCGAKIDWEWEGENNG